MEVAQPVRGRRLPVFSPPKALREALKAHGVKALEVRKLEQESPNTCWTWSWVMRSTLIIDIPAAGRGTGARTDW